MDMTDENALTEALKRQGEYEERIATLERQIANAQDWIDTAVASCARKRCAMRERQLAEAFKARDVAEKAQGEAVDLMNSECRRLERQIADAQSILATTADRLNTALRESGCGEITGSPFHSCAIRDGVVVLYDRFAKWRRDCDRLQVALDFLLDCVWSDEDRTASSPRAADIARTKALATGRDN